MSLQNQCQKGKIFTYFVKWLLVLTFISKGPMRYFSLLWYFEYDIYASLPLKIFGCVFFVHNLPPNKGKLNIYWILKNAK